MERSSKAIGAMLTTIQEEYLDCPDLHLTFEQALCRWQLERVELDALLEVLSETGFLVRDGQWIHRSFVNTDRAA
jgi:hypothetical protein